MDEDHDSGRWPAPSTRPSGPAATTTRRKGAFQASALADLVDLIGFAHWLGYACVALVLSLVATTTVMSVQDRIREHAILQTRGLRPARVFRLVIAESLLMYVIGGVLGTATALAVLASGGMAVGAEGVTIAFCPSWQLARRSSVRSAMLEFENGTSAGMSVRYTTSHGNRRRARAAGRAAR